MTKTRTVRIKRAYEARSPEEGHRVLVDRLWPRGVRKNELLPDEWVREIAPSDELRKWFAHEPERWTEFQARYRRELGAGPARDALERLVGEARRGPLTLLYGARDEEHNNAVVIQALIERKLSRERPKRPARPRAEPRRAGVSSGRTTGRPATRSSVTRSRSA